MQAQELVVPLRGRARRQNHPFLRTPTAPIAIPSTRRALLSPPSPRSPVRRDRDGGASHTLDDQLVFRLSPDRASPVLSRFVRPRREPHRRFAPADLQVRPQSPQQHPHQNAPFLAALPLPPVRARPTERVRLTPAQRFAKQHSGVPSQPQRYPAPAVTGDDDPERGRRVAVAVRPNVNAQLPSPATSSDEREPVVLAATEAEARPLSPVWDASTHSPSSVSVYPAYGLRSPVSEKETELGEEAAPLSSQRSGSVSSSALSLSSPVSRSPAHWKASSSYFQTDVLDRARAAEAQLSFAPVTASIVGTPRPSSTLLGTRRGLALDSDEEDQHCARGRSPTAAKKDESHAFGRVQRDLRQILKAPVVESRGRDRARKLRRF